MQRSPRRETPRVQRRSFLKRALRIFEEADAKAMPWKPDKWPHGRRGQQGATACKRSRVLNVEQALDARSDSDEDAVQ